MANKLDVLREFALRLADKEFGIAKQKPTPNEHHFDLRNIHPKIREVSEDLFDGGHYNSATLKTYVLIENMIKESNCSKEIGFKLMMKVFDETGPLIKLNALSGENEKNEQKGFKFIFAGVVAGIRNPRAHTTDYPETMDQCLDHLSLASLLLRKLETSPQFLSFKIN